MKLIEFKTASGQRLLVKSTEVASLTPYHTKDQTIIQLPGGKHIVKGDIDYVVKRLGGNVHAE